MAQAGQPALALGLASALALALAPARALARGKIAARFALSARDNSPPPRRDREASGLSGFSAARWRLAAGQALGTRVAAALGRFVPEREENPTVKPAEAANATLAPVQ
jgi:hypothetical protein